MRQQGRAHHQKGPESERLNEFNGLTDLAYSSVYARTDTVRTHGWSPMRPLVELDLDTFRRVIDVNLTGLFLCTKAAAA